MDQDLPVSFLIIEDNTGDQVLLQENLLQTNLVIAEIVMVHSLSEGMTHLRKQDFSLIFLDLFLPDSAGLESFSELLKVNPSLPVIIYSGLADTKVALKAIALGAQDFLIKGEYDISLLEKAVRYSIERRRNLAEIEKSNSRYNLISKATHDMVWDWDLVTGEVYRNNEGWKKIFRSVKNLAVGIKEDWPLKVHPDDRQRVEREVGEAIASPTQQQFEAAFRIIRDDDTIGYLEDRGFIIRNEQKKAVRLIGASRDITERKNAEKKVLLSEQRFKSLVQNSADLLAILDADGNYSYVSPTSKSILGYDPEFFIGKSPVMFIHEDDVKKTMQHLGEIATEKVIKVPVFRFRNSAGEWRWIESTITDLTGDESVRGIVVNSRDVTEKKIADDEIEKLSMIARETINWVVIGDKDRNVLWANNAFTKISGYELADVQYKNLAPFLQGPETDKAVLENIKENFQKKISFVFEIIFYTKAKKQIQLHVQVQPILDEHGEIRYTISMATDITAERILEAKVKLEKLAKQKQITDAVYAAQEKERSEIGRELHDNVNQLLGAARLYIDMAGRNDESRQSLLTSASSYTLTAIEEIRKLSKTLITPIIDERTLTDLIKDLAAEIMLVHPIHIEVTANDFSASTWDDKFKLNVYRIIQEQLNNILKHAEAKNIYIDISEYDEEILLSIEDNGIGFDMASQKTGVGLTNIKSRSGIFNGIVSLTSSPGKGTLLSIAFNKSSIIENLHPEHLKNNQEK